MKYTIPTIVNFTLIQVIDDKVNIWILNIATLREGLIDKVFS